MFDADLQVGGYDEDVVGGVEVEIDASCFDDEFKGFLKEVDECLFIIFDVIIVLVKLLQIEVFKSMMCLKFGVYGDFKVLFNCLIIQFF